ncbi:MAG: hypothetical protein ACLFNO_00140 [Parcubacteria group bacterium]
MKKLLVSVSILLAIVFSGCEKLFEDPVSPYENYAHYRIHIRNNDEWAKSLYFTVFADPPTDYIHVKIGSVAQEGGTKTYEFKLPLDVYEGKTFTLRLYTGPNFDEAKHKAVKKVTVEKSSFKHHLDFHF